MQYCTSKSFFVATVFISWSRMAGEVLKKVNWRNLFHYIPVFFSHVSWCSGSRISQKASVFVKWAQNALRPPGPWQGCVTPLFMPRTLDTGSETPVCFCLTHYNDVEQCECFYWKCFFFFFFPPYVPPLTVVDDELQTLAVCCRKGHFFFPP